jgi:thiamine-monophosphate kinase
MVKGPPERPGEFEFIETYMAPLAAGNEGALGLKDDAALFDVTPGHRAVVTTDALIAGIHFRPDDPPDSVGAKALAVNLSDLASMGAAPLGYTLILALPEDWTGEWAAGFSAGLAAMQQRYSLQLLGGDTVAANGPLTIGVTAFGSAPAGRQIMRSGAGDGDDIWVSGSIGDAALALAIYNEGDTGRMAAPEYGYLLDRLQRPEPRVALGQNLIGLATAAIDISDGLAADLGHLCRASAIGADIEAESIPLSAAALGCVGASSSYGMDIVIGGGDDYELLFTAPPNQAGGVMQAAEKSDCPVTRIGRANAEKRVRFAAADGQEMEIEKSGWSHF